MSTHIQQRKGWQPQRQVIALGALGFFIAMILGALYLSQVVSEATTHRRLVDLMAQRDELERINEQLQAEIAEERAVPQLQTKAEALGFRLALPGEIEYLPVRGYTPFTVDTVAPLEQEEEPAPDYDETFTGWLQQQLDYLTNSLDDLVGGF